MLTMLMLMFNKSYNVFFFFLNFVPNCRTDNGRDEAESGAGERTVGGRGEKADRVGEATGSGRN